MQKLKDDIRQCIVAVAREEFIAHGARSTSIRTVARRAGIAAGNVYNYCLLYTSPSPRDCS